MTNPVDYVRAGWALCHVPHGAKGPEGPGAKGWNRRERAITSEEQARRLQQNFGLCHAYSGTCAVDIDDYKRAKAWFAEQGLNLDSYLEAPDSVHIISGRPNRGKLLFRLSKPLPTVKLAPYSVTVDGREKEYHALEFRCATRKGTTMQDVLPPSIHPDTGKSYRWRYGNELVADWRNPPELPDELRELWEQKLAPANDRSEIPPPEGVDADEIRALLEEHDPDLGYDNWVEIGMALHHEASGDDWGLALWDEWSAGGAKYVGYEDLEKHWRSFGDHPNPKTLASLRPPKVADVDDFEVIDPEQEELLIAERRPRIELVQLADVVRPGPIKYVVDGLLEEGELFGLVGRRKSGKSYAAFDLAFAVAQGRPWAGRDVLKQGPVVWIAAEGARSMLTRRGPQWLAHYGHADIRLWPRGLNLMKREIRDALIEVCDGAALVVVDSLRRVTPGAAENSSDEFTLALENAESIALETGAAVALIAHAGKDITKGTRGTSAIEDQLEAAFGFEKDDDSGLFEMVSLFSRDEASGDESWFFGLKPIAPEGMAPGVILDWDVQPPLSRGSGEGAGPQGPYQVAVMKVAQDLIMFTDAVDCETVVEEAVRRLPPAPDSAGKDRRRQYTRAALRALVSRDLLQVVDDSIIGGDW